MNTTVMSRRKEDPSKRGYKTKQPDAMDHKQIKLSDSFQEIMYLEFMNLNVSYIIISSAFKIFIVNLLNTLFTLP